MASVRGARRDRDARVMRGQERNSALFAAVLSVKRMRQALYRQLDVDSLASTAAACVAGRRSVAALGDKPWLRAIAAIQRDLTHDELPPARPGVYTTRAARDAGEAAYARAVAEQRVGGMDWVYYAIIRDRGYQKAHWAEMRRTAKARARARAAGLFARAAVCWAAWWRWRTG